jgi:hypothetical protein
LSAKRAAKVAELVANATAKAKVQVAKSAAAAASEVLADARLACESAETNASVSSEALVSAQGEEVAAKAQEAGAARVAAEALAAFKGAAARRLAAERALAAAYAAAVAVFSPEQRQARQEDIRQAKATLDRVAAEVRAAVANLVDSQDRCCLDRLRALCVHCPGCASKGFVGLQYIARAVSKNALGPGNMFHVYSTEKHESDFCKQSC